MGWGVPGDAPFARRALKTAPIPPISGPEHKARTTVPRFTMHLDKYSKLASWWPIWLLLSARVVLSTHVIINKHAFGLKIGLT